MKTKIKEVQNYFKSAILEGRYEVKEFFRHYSVKVLIDGEYNFNLWVCNGEQSFRVSGSPTHSFMEVELNEDEKKAGYAMIMSKTADRAKRLAELKAKQDELDKELQSLQP